MPGDAEPATKKGKTAVVNCPRTHKEGEGDGEKEVTNPVRTKEREKF